MVIVPFSMAAVIKVNTTTLHGIGAVAVVQTAQIALQQIGAMSVRTLAWTTTGTVLALALVVPTQVGMALAPAQAVALAVRANTKVSTPECAKAVAGIVMIAITTTLAMSVVMATPLSVAHAHALAVTTVTTWSAWETTNLPVPATWKKTGQVNVSAQVGVITILATAVSVAHGMRSGTSLANHV